MNPNADPVLGLVEAATRVLIVVGVATLAAGLAAHVCHAVRLAGGLGLASLVFGMASYGASVPVVLGHAENNATCASCHVMGPYLQDLTDPASESLAATHYRERWVPAETACYTCHAQRGLTGLIQAKAEGTIDLVKFYSNTYARPIVMRGAGYPNVICMKCHSAEGATFRISHAKSTAALLANTRRCLDCHGASPAHNISTEEGDER